MEPRTISIRKKELAAEGKRIYRSIKDELEREHKGRIVVIDTETGDYFLGDTLAEADRKARQKYPHKVFYAIKIGYPAVYVHR